MTVPSLPMKRSLLLTLSLSTLTFAAPARAQLVDKAPRLIPQKMTTVLGATEADVARRAVTVGRDVATLRREGLAGSVQEAVDVVSGLAELGADRFYLQLLDMRDLEHLAFIAEELLPRLR